ncbi:MAG: hypothetical protein ACLQIB_48960 [Isosphaeraceae bacterium]
MFRLVPRILFVPLFHRSRVSRRDETADRGIRGEVIALFDDHQSGSSSVLADFRWMTDVFYEGLLRKETARLFREGNPLGRSTVRYAEIVLELGSRGSPRCSTGTFRGTSVPPLTETES